MSRNVYAAALLIVSSSLIAQDRKLSESAVPIAVKNTVKVESRGATIKGYSTEVEGGKRVYEVEMMVSGHSKDLQISADGTLTEVEEQVELASLPQEVQAGLTKAAAGAKITKVESLTKRGKLVAYEAVTLKGARKSEIQVGPTGNKLAHNE
jgi:hypothetical protein